MSRADSTIGGQYPHPTTLTAVAAHAMANMKHL
jgi:hypothetical protein